MKHTRLSLFYLAGYLIPTGLCLYFAPRWFMKLLFSNRQYDDAFPQFSGVLLFGIGLIVLAIIRYGNPDFYRITLVVRVVFWLGILGIYLNTRDPFFIAVLCVLGFGMLLTGTIYFLERHK